MLAVIETHPIQYHAPVYRALQRDFGIPVTAVYGSDFSVIGYRDAEFATTFAWDTDLLSGYAARFLSRVSDGGTRTPETTSASGLPRHLHEIDPKAVLLVGYSPRFYQRALWDAWRTQKPLLFRAETTDHASRRATIKAKLRDGMLRFFYGRCERLLYVGTRSYQHFSRLGCSAQKLVFSPYCVDTNSFQTDESGRSRLRAPARTALGVSEEETILLLSGKLVRRKRADLLVEAVKVLPKVVRDRVRVVALGSGEEQPRLEEIARRHPAITFTCVGFQNQSRLSAYYHAADLLVLPSDSGETWGLVVNEALHHGLPCIVSDAVGCAPDLIMPGLTGEVFERGSADSLAAALQRALRLTDNSAARETCRSRVSGYSVAKAAEGIAQAYRDVVRAG